jgi:hypothetical protein
MYTTLLENFNSTVNLSIPGIRDRGYVLIEKNLVGVLDRTSQTSVIIDLTNIQNPSLHIIVENMGRLNYGGDMLDTKVSDISSLKKFYLKSIVSFKGYNFECLYQWKSYF